MADLIDVKDFLGTKKVLVGTGKSDIVLNTYGNVWLRTGNKTVKLQDYIKDLADNNQSNPSVVLTNDITSAKKQKGSLYYDTVNNILYLYDGVDFIEISNNNDKSTLFVNASGGIFSGPVSFGDSISVSSSDKVNNLNADLLDGHDASDFILRDDSISLDKIMVSEIIFDNLSSSDGVVTYNKNTSEFNVSKRDNIDTDTRIFQIIQKYTEDVFPDLYINSDTRLQDVYPDMNFYDYKDFDYDAVYTEEKVYISKYLDSLDDLDPSIKLSPDASLVTSGLGNDKYISTTLISAMDNVFTSFLIKDSDYVDIELSIDGETLSSKHDARKYSNNGFTGYIIEGYFGNITSNKPIYVLSFSIYNNINITNVPLLSNLFDSEAYTLYFANGRINKYYRYYNSFLGEFCYCNKDLSIGDIYSNGVDCFVVTNNIYGISVIRFDYKMLTTPDDISKFVKIGNISNNTYRTHLLGSDRIGINRCYISDSDDVLDVAIPVSFATEFEENNNYYYIYSENFMCDSECRRISNDILLVLSDDNVGLLIESNGSMISLRTGLSLDLKLHGLPTSDPHEKDRVYNDNGILKISI